ncbi:hypothetical protein [Microbulbifer discodermiae]|uniref:hypothetical protein n=1 Tax=Microbulbifer sp. 2201CG32-9 TaxID=3232309 RepID=UPI00345BAF78
MHSKKNIFLWSLCFVAVAAFAATYYTSMDGDVANTEEVNLHIKTEVNKDVSRWRSGDKVVVTSTTTGDKAVYTYQSMRNEHYMTSYIPASSGDEGGSGSGGSGGDSGGGTGGSGLGGGDDLGGGNDGDPTCYSHLPCTTDGIFGGAG